MATSDIITIAAIENEEWRDVHGYEGLYRVSNLGRVMRLARKAENGYYMRDRILRCEPKSDYKQVDLRTKDDTRKLVRVHLLVARAFLGECPDGYEVNHIDADKRNAALSNLEYVTHIDNMRHARSSGLLHLHIARDAEIRARKANGESTADIARCYNLSHSRICQICCN